MELYSFQYSQIFRSHAKVCVEMEALWGPSCFVMFLTTSEVETWFNYSKNTIMFIKKNQNSIAFTNY